MPFISRYTLSNSTSFGLGVLYNIGIVVEFPSSSCITVSSSSTTGKTSRQMSAGRSDMIMNATAYQFLDIFYLAI